MKKLLLILALLVSFFSLQAATPGDHYKTIYQRYLRTGKASAADRAECRALYGAMVVAGRFFAPEGAAMLDHYINGKGKTLTLDNSYIKNSPVIKNALRTMKVGETRRVTFTQKQDWRLSYVFNPLHITKGKHTVTVYERIIFKKDKDTYTALNYGFGKLLLPDGLVHVLNPKPYLLRTSWAY